MSPSYLGSIPAELGQLSNFKCLVLKDNKLTGVHVGDARVATLFKPRVSLLLSRFHTIGTWPACEPDRAPPHEKPTYRRGVFGDARIATLIEPHVSLSCLGSIPAELGQLSNLKNLNLARNQLTGVM